MKATVYQDGAGFLHIWRGYERIKFPWEKSGEHPVRQADIFVQDGYDVKQILFQIPKEDRAEVIRGWPVHTEVPDEYFPPEEPTKFTLYLERVVCNWQSNSQVGSPKPNLTLGSVDVDYALSKGDVALSGETTLAQDEVALLLRLQGMIEQRINKGFYTA